MFGIGLDLLQDPFIALNSLVKIIRVSGMDNKLKQKCTYRPCGISIEEKNREYEKWHAKFLSEWSITDIECRNDVTIVQTLGFLSKFIRFLRTPAKC